MTTITACPYCGTTYFEARSNCENCGAALPPPTAYTLPGAAVLDSQESPYIRSAPPMPPRPVPRGYLMRRLSPDPGYIVGLVFSILGGVFLFLGVILGVNAAGVMVWVFLPLGLVFFAVGLALFFGSIAKARQQASILRDGLAATGRIESMQRDYSVQVNGRSPLVIRYTFNVLGRPYEGKVTTLREPDSDLRPAAPVYVLFHPDHPERNALYLDL